MHPPTKDQTHIGADAPKVDASHREDNKDRTRQEYKQDADINYMLGRFGVVPNKGQPIYGEWDDTLDLQLAMQAVRDARYAYGNLPEEMRKRFRSMEELIAAVENGSLVIKDEEPEPKATTTTTATDNSDSNSNDKDRGA